MMLLDPPMSTSQGIVNPMVLHPPEEQLRGEEEEIYGGSITSGVLV
jgi:hypothetical protein